MTDEVPDFVLAACKRVKGKYGPVHASCMTICLDRLPLNWWADVILTSKSLRRAWFGIVKSAGLWYWFTHYYTPDGKHRVQKEIKGIQERFEQAMKTFKNALVGELAREAYDGLLMVMEKNGEKEISSRMHHARALLMDDEMGSIIRTIPLALRKVPAYILRKLKEKITKVMTEMVTSSATQMAVTKEPPLKGIQRKKKIKEQRKYNQKHKQQIQREMEKQRKRTCHGKPKGCSRQERVWKHPREGAEMRQVARELVRLAKRITYAPTKNMTPEEAKKKVQDAVKEMQALHDKATKAEGDKLDLKLLRNRVQQALREDVASLKALAGHLDLDDVDIKKVETALKKDLAALKKKSASEEGNRQASESLFYALIDPKDIHKLKSEVDEQTYELALKVAVQLAKDFTPDRNQREAINRLKMSVSGHVRGADLHRNNIFKAAHALGIKLPSMMF